MSPKPGRNVRKVYFTSISIVKHVLLVSGVFVLIMVSFKPFGLGKIKFQFLTVIVATANNEIRIATPLVYRKKKKILLMYGKFNIKSNQIHTTHSIFFLSLFFSDKAYIVFSVFFPL